MRSVIKSMLKAGLFPALAIAAMVAAPCAWAQGTSFTYQGQLDDSGYVADGSYDMEFKIWNASSGGAQVGGTATFFAVPVDGGLFSQDLDFGSSVFTGSDRWLEISVKTNGVIGFITLSPRTKFTSAPYAIAAITAQSAASVPYGSIGSSEVDNDSLTYKDLGPNSVGTSEVINDSLLAEDLAPNSVTASEIATSAVGALEIAANAVGTSEIASGGVASSEVLDNSLKAVDLAANSVTASEIATGAVGTSEVADGSLTTSDLNLASIDARYVEVAGDTMTGNLSLRTTLTVTDDGGDIATVLAGGVGGYQFLYNRTGKKTIHLDGDDSYGGYISVRNTNGSIRVVLEGEGDGSGGEIALNNSTGVEVANLTASGGGSLFLNESDGTAGVSIGGGVGGWQRLYQSDGSYGIYLDGDSSGAGKIQVYDVAGSATIILDGDYGGDGRIICDELQINGGSDLSEQFDIDGFSQDVKPGMIVCIDAANPGKLMVSSKAYDRKVAGVISGANGVKPGMMMGQTGTVADGEYAVALTGRVYCMVDAGQGAIEPGDLITTSDVPGHGMRVADHGQAQGAIIGKAMTPLAEGQGLVLVLVSLQ